MLEFVLGHIFVRKIEKMQAIKEKLLHKNSEMRKIKDEAKEEEKMEKEMAKARAEVAHEVRLAKEAEGAMTMHVNKAVERVEKHEAKYGSGRDHQISTTPADDSPDPCASNVN